MANSEQPHWHGMQGVRRVQSEFKVSLYIAVHLLALVLHGLIASANLQMINPAHYVWHARHTCFSQSFKMEIVLQYS